jgi:hypothetical protein
MKSKIASWAMVMIGIFGIALFLWRLDTDISTGIISYTSSKFGFFWVGLPALLMQLGEFALSILLLFIGYRDIKKIDRGGA